jgi:hypothetical protein
VKWRLLPDLRIGSINAADYTLTEVIALTVGDDGAIYVAQWNEPTVQVFDGEGRFAFTIGRRGGGPGEFSQPARLGWMGDTLWVVDMPIGRVSLFTPDGVFLNSFNLVSPPISEYYSGLVPVALQADGSVVSQPMTASRLISSGVVDSIPLFRSDHSGERLDTLAWLSVKNTQLAIEYPGGGLYTAQPVSDEKLYDSFSSGNGIILVERFVPAKGRTNEYKVLRLGMTGDTVLSKSIPYDPVPLSQQCRDHIVEDLVSKLDRYIPGPPEGAILEALFLPAVHPPVKNLVAGRDGTIWLQVASARTDSAVWNVLDPAGELIGVVTAPIGLKVLEAEKDLIWGVERDSLDVSYIFRFRVLTDSDDAA